MLSIFFCSANNLFCFLLLTADIHPSVTSGVVSNVVRLPGTRNVEEAGIVKAAKRSLPAMLQTTAAVYPGASGGAVVNSAGRMIGLITRYLFFFCCIKFICKQYVLEDRMQHGTHFYMPSL